MYTAEVIYFILTMCKKKSYFHLYFGIFIGLVINKGKENNKNQDQINIVNSQL